MDPAACYQLTSSLLRQLLTALAATPGGVPPVAYDTTGQVALDECCPDSSADLFTGTGMLVVTVQRMFSSSKFPVPDNTLQAEPFTQLAADIGFVVARCVPCLGSAIAPTPGSLEAAAQVQQADGTALGCAVFDFIQAPPLDGMGMLTTLVPYGPEGCCGGWTGTLVASVTSFMSS